MRLLRILQLPGLYREIKLEYNCPDNSDYGTILCYYAKNSLRKIDIQSIIVEENSQNLKFYLWDNELFFIFYPSIAPQYIDANNTNYHYREGRYYVHRSELIKCLEKEYISGGNDDPESALKNTANSPGNCNDFNDFKTILFDIKKILEEQINDDDILPICLW